MPIVTLVYALANVSYLIVLTPEEIVSSPAVAVVSPQHDETSSILNTLIGFILIRRLANGFLKHSRGSCKS